MSKNWKHFATSDFWAAEPKKVRGPLYSAAIEVTVWNGASDASYLSASALVLCDLPQKCLDFDPEIVSAVKLAEAHTASDLASSASSLRL